jgi:tripartite-type tricarboxylate transporter receptor subunit TctC
MGQQVVVDNRTGATGHHRHRSSPRNSPPDGYTLLIWAMRRRRP